MNGATSDLSVTHYLYSAQHVEVNHPLRGEQSRPVLGGGDAPSHCAAECRTWQRMRGYATPCPTGKTAAAAVKCRKLAEMYGGGLIWQREGKKIMEREENN